MIKKIKLLLMTLILSIISSWKFTKLIKRKILILKNSILLCLGGNIKANGVLCEELGSLFVEDEMKDVKIKLDDEFSSAQLYHIYGS